MTDEIRPRGPDDDGLYVDEAAGIAFGFRRLAIIDVTPAGHQPMVSASGQTVIIFNGEIYNANELRPDLKAKGRDFRGHSDTEVLLEALEAWGVETTLARCVGMFALAVYDKRTRLLTLARDRFGKKPLYYGEHNNCLFFGSQSRAVRNHPLFKQELDDEALSAFIRLGYVPASHSIYRGMRQVSPGAFVQIQPGGVPQTHYYWRTERVAASRRLSRGADEEECIASLHAQLSDAVRVRMISDVPLGAFLSGGIDSSLIVALMQSQSSAPIKTFTIGFHESDHNEAPYARQVAGHLKTDHHELYLSGKDALAVVPELPEIFDEPFADSSQIPTFLVSRFARGEVTVALSGDGGDELFGGYSRYLGFQKLAGTGGNWKSLSLLARFARHVGTPAYIRSIVPAHLRASAKSWAERLARHDSQLSLEDIYLSLVSQGFDPALVLARNSEVVDRLWRGSLAGDFPEPIERAQIIDTLTYLPGDILTKVDRASMANSLEVRAPLLDHRVMELAWALPPSMKVRSGVQKWALRAVVEKYLPAGIFDRPKMGFGVPIERWLRGPLREWAEDLLNPHDLRADGIFNVEAVRSYWERHLSGETWHYRLWCVLMFQAWKRRWMSR
jgi:asparagine synthase (glutamine-hydrolysing)